MNTPTETVSGLGTWDIPKSAEIVVLTLMRQQLETMSAQTEELWQQLKVAEAAMAPYKEKYDQLLGQWSNSHRMADAIQAVLKAKQSEVVP